MGSFWWILGYYESTISLLIVVIIIITQRSQTKFTQTIILKNLHFFVCLLSCDFSFPLDSNIIVTFWHVQKIFHKQSWYGFWTSASSGTCQRTHWITYAYVHSQSSSWYEAQWDKKNSEKRKAKTIQKEDNRRVWSVCIQHQPNWNKRYLIRYLDNVQTVRR